MCIFHGQQSSFNPDTTREQQFAEFDNAHLTLICSDEIRQFLPCANDAQALFRITDNRLRSCQRNRSVWAHRANRPNNLRASSALEGFTSGIVEGVDVDRVRASFNACARRCCDGRGRSRSCGMNSFAIQRDLQKGIARHGLQILSRDEESCVNHAPAILRNRSLAKYWAPPSSIACTIKLATYSGLSPSA